MLKLMLIMGLIMILSHSNMMIFMLIIMELLNILFLILVLDYMNLEIMLLSLFIQVLDSLVMMVFAIMSLFSWEKSYNWSVVLNISV